MALAIERGSARTSSAETILAYASSTAQSLFETFGLIRETQGARGAPTDQQQDILRSMLVLALAGLDAAVKRLVEDTVPLLSQFSEATEAAISEFAERRLTSEQGTRSARYLVKLLRAESSSDTLELDFVDELTAGSMQSVEQLLRVCDVLGIKSQELDRTVLALRSAFRTRNEIIHEMDINFAPRNRNRTSRTRAAMVAETNRVLETGKAVVEAVDRLIEEHRGTTSS